MANINQWKVGDIISASRLNEMVNAINDILAQQQVNPSNFITTEQLTTILRGYSDVGHTHTISEIVDLVLPTVPTKTSQLQNDSDFATNASVDEKIANAATGGTVDLSSYAKKTDLPTRTGQLTNDSGFITEIPSEYITENELNAKGYLTQHQDISNKADRSEIPTRTSQLENNSGFITEVPSEYITETELQSKGLATETFVTNKIAEASISGGEVDLSGLGADLSLNGQTLKLKNSNGQEIGTGVTLPQASTIDAYTKQETDNIIQDYTGGKKQVYLTQAEYDLLTDSEKNDATKVYNITDATEQVIPQDLNLDSNNLLQLKDKDGNKIGTGVSIPNTYTLPPATANTLGGIKVGSNLSIDSNGVLSADVQQGTPSNELILTSPSGYRFKVIVNDEGVLSTEEIVTLGNIIASVSELSINEGESATFTISLSETPTRAQTITIVSDNTDVTVNPSSLNISDTNPHTITVSVAEDDTDYADETATLTLSSANVSNVTINVSITDNDIEPKPCTGISLDQTSLSLTKGKTKQLIATVTPEGCTDEIVWSASNENCTVVNGLVKAVTEGDCVITAQCGEYNATCTITVIASTNETYTSYNLGITSKTTSSTVNEDGSYTISNTEGGWDLINFGDTEQILTLGASYNLCFELLNKEVDSYEVGTNWNITHSTTAFKDMQNATVGEIIKIKFTNYAVSTSDKLVFVQLGDTMTGTGSVTFKIWVEETYPNIVIADEGVVSDGILMNFNSSLITASVGEHINGTTINDDSVDGQTIQFSGFSDDGTDGITADKGLLFMNRGAIEPITNSATTVFGGSEETSIRTLELFGRVTQANSGNKGIGGICHQHSPINYSRQYAKRLKDGFENTCGGTFIRQMNFPAFGGIGVLSEYEDGYFHVVITDNSTKDANANNLPNWLSFKFGGGANTGYLQNTVIYNVRLYNRVLTKMELDHNMQVDLQKVRNTGVVAFYDFSNIGDNVYRVQNLANIEEFGTIDDVLSRTNDSLVFNGKGQLTLPIAPAKDLTTNFRLDIHISNITLEDYIGNTIVDCLETTNYTGGIIIQHGVNVTGNTLAFRAFGQSATIDVTDMSTIKFTIKRIGNTITMLVNDEQVAQGNQNNAISENNLVFGIGKFNLRYVRYQENISE